VYSFFVNRQDRLGPLLIQGGQKGAHLSTDGFLGAQNQALALNKPQGYSSYDQLGLITARINSSSKPVDLFTK
jgi:hypothetical protein